MMSLFVLIILVGFTIPSYAKQIPDPVEAKLVSDVITVKPGESFSLGVLFEIDPGWHIYWKNPGNTGLPTEVYFIVPDTYKVGELNWPPAETFKNTKGGTDYGYEKSVLLWSSIHVPSNAIVNSDITLQAQVLWLSCKEICIPGKAKFEYLLSISNSRKHSNIDIFSKWQERLDK